MLVRYINENITKIAENMKSGDTLRKLKLPPLSKFIKKTFAYKNNPEAFNVYCPLEKEADKGIIIDIHGGAWIYGDIHLNDEYCEYLCLQGYKVLSLDYPLLGQEKTNIQVIANYLVEVLNYVFDKKEDLNLDFSKILLTGDSAGGHLALIFYSLLSSKTLREIYKCEEPKVKSDNVKLITFCFPVLEPQNFIKATDDESLKLQSYFNYLMFKDVDEEVKKYTSLSQIGSLVKFPRILLITSKKDYFNFQSEMAKSIFEKHKVEIEYKEFAYDEKLDHVFNIGYYHLNESIEINNYMINLFKSL